MKSWYEELFTNYANAYDKQPFTQGTVAEVDFIETEIQQDRSKTILDIGCGTGRHAVELAKRGYSVVGIDLSASQLQQARAKAQREGVQVTFIQADARDFNFDNPFDVVIMLCEGAFALMETDEMNFKILANAAQSLRTNGKFIFTSLNVLYPLYHSVADFINANSNVNSSVNTFDLLTFRDSATITITDDLGNEKNLQYNERYYAPSEITWLLKSLNFNNIAIHGCNIGDFSRNNPLTSENLEMLVIAQQ
jgi:2-polyprenyl-3-methyl-5-hydroxy-6-metoxy-1,4-benzoquinol methylase